MERGLEGGPSNGDEKRGLGCKSCLPHSQHPTNTVNLSAFSTEIYDYSGKGSNMPSFDFDRTTPS